MNMGWEFTQIQYYQSPLLRKLGNILRAKKPTMYLDNNVFGSFTQGHSARGYNYYSFIKAVNDSVFPNTSEFLVTNTPFTEFEKLGIERRDFINVEKFEATQSKYWQKCVGKKGDELNNCTTGIIKCLYRCLENEIKRGGKFNLNYFLERYLECYNEYVKCLPEKFKVDLVKYFHHKGSNRISDEVVEMWKIAFIVDVLASLTPSDVEVGQSFYFSLLDEANNAKRGANFCIPMTRVGYNFSRKGADSVLKYKKSRNEVEKCSRSLELTKALKLIKYKQNEDMVDAELVHCAVVRDTLPSDGGVPYFFTCDPIDKIIARVGHYKHLLKKFNKDSEKNHGHKLFDQRKKSFLVFLNQSDLGIEKIIEVANIPDLIEWIKKGRTVNDMVTLVEKKS